MKRAHTLIRRRRMHRALSRPVMIQRLLPFLHFGRKRTRIVYGQNPEIEAPIFSYVYLLTYITNLHALVM